MGIRTRRSQRTAGRGADSTQAATATRALRHPSSGQLAALPASAASHGGRAASAAGVCAAIPPRRSLTPAPMPLTHCATALPTSNDDLDCHPDNHPDNSSFHRGDVPDAKDANEAPVQLWSPNPSAPPTPSPSPSAAPQTVDPDATTLALLDEVRSIMTDSRTAGAQTEFALRSIADEVRGITTRQHAYERKYVFSSVVSYLLFCVLIFAVVYFIFAARTNTNTVDQQYYENELKLLSERLAMTEAELKKFNDAARVANEIYQLVEQGMHEVALDRFIKQGDRITNRTEFSLLREKIESLKWKLAEDTYRKGVEFFTQEDFERARDTFYESLAFQSETPYATLLNYHLGMSLYALRDFEGARRALEKALSGPLPREHQDNARYHRAAATEALGAIDDAYELYGDYLTFHRSGKYGDSVVQIRDRIDRRRLLDQKAAERAERERKRLRQLELDGGAATPPPN